MFFYYLLLFFFFFFSSRRRHTRLTCDWSSDVCSSDLRLLKKIAEALLALSQPIVGAAQRVLHTQSFDLCAHALCEYPHHGKAARPVRHGFVVDNRDVTEDPALRIQHRHAAITLRAPVGEQLIVGKSCAKLRRIVGGLPAQYEFAWSAGQRQFDVLAEAVALPER